ncbi:hypothetical protein NliqN6_3600 [Naganishia liquefaciens]|uniref:Uncharacterized protein n=1 Tax=Naganishia liquefaciens TaxID=104408 RepID=A0A8H3TUM4_9TREE|nr:hypothetical protein NliqN6_3600 [Naganishia liquefaciens]
MQSDRHDGCSAASNLSHSLPSAGGLSKGGIGSESWLKPPAFPDVSLGVPTRPVIDKAAKQDGCKNIGRDTRDYAGVSESFPRTRLSSRDSQRQAGSSLPPTETGGWELSLSGKTLFGPATCFAPLIVNLDSGFDDETHMALLHGLEHTSQEEEEEEQRIRYFRTMDLSLERRFSDVVQLEPDEDPDSDDDDCQERLITPGTLAEPDAWLLKTPRAEHPMVETKNGSSRHSKQFSGFVSSPSERPLNLSPSVEIDQARSSTVPERCVPSGMFRILSASSPMQPQSLEREVAQTAGVEQSALRQEIQTSSDYLLQEGLPMSRLSIISPLSILSKPMSRQGTFAPKAIVRTSAT